MKYLIEHGTEININEFFGRTSLIYVCEKENEAIVKMVSWAWSWYK